MIDTERETIIPLSDVPRRLPSRVNGKKLSRMTVWRWTRQGLSGVLLETTPIGGGDGTSVEALTRFLNAVKRARDKRRERIPFRTLRQRQRAFEAARARLDAAGVGR